MKKNLKKALSFGAFIVLLISQACFAECSWTSETFTTADITYDKDLSNIPASESSYIIDTFHISRNDLASLNGAASSFTDIIHCTSPGDLITISGAGWTVYPMPGAGDLSYFIKPNPNIGIGLYIRNSSSTNAWGYPMHLSGVSTTLTVEELLASSGTDYATRGGYLDWFDLLQGGANLSIYAYKQSGHVGQGLLPSGKIATISAGNTPLVNIHFVGGEVQTATCTVNTPTSQVSFGTEYIQRFKNKGDSAGETAFNINVQCQSRLIKPALIFDGDTDVENQTVFNNSSGPGYAAGVGVQLLKDNKVVIPREVISLGAVTTAATDHAFSARLVSLDDNMTPGAIDTSVVFTLFYQ